MASYEAHIQAPLPRFDVYLQLDHEVVPMELKGLTTYDSKRVYMENTKNENADPFTQDTNNGVV